MLQDYILLWSLEHLESPAGKWDQKKFNAHCWTLLVNPAWLHKAHDLFGLCWTGVCVCVCEQAMHFTWETYKNVSYLAEGIEFEKLDLPKEIKVKIGQEELEYAI